MRTTKHTQHTSGMEDSVHNEPSFTATFNNDLNGYLKWEALGKTEQASPRFRSLVAGYRRSMGRTTAGQKSARDIITAASK